MPDPTITSAGDELQSAASRMAEWILTTPPEIEGDPFHGRESRGEPPYEVRMAALEAKDAVKDWTEARTNTSDRLGQLVATNEREMILGWLRSNQAGRIAAGASGDPWYIAGKLAEAIEARIHHKEV